MAEIGFEHYPAPPRIAPSPDFILTINGEAVFVYATPVASVTIVTAAGALAVAVRPTFAFTRAVVRPLSRGIAPQVADGVIHFTTPPPSPTAPTLLSLELDDELRRPLFLFVNPPEEAPPQPGAPDMIYLESGKVHDLGHVELHSGQTLYLAGGAVLRGNIVARGAKGISIRGRGIVDGSAHTPQNPAGERLLHLSACQDVLIEGVTLLNGQTWQIMPAGCERVTIRNVKIVSGAPSDDGMDLVGCRDVVVEDCFVRTKDDCIAIKGFPGYHRDESAGQNVARIRVQHCVFWNAEWGNVLEIGYETRVESIRDIVFRDCDVIHCEAERYGSGGVLTIHNGDRAEITEVLYEDIRVEDAREKLVDFKICFDRYSRDAERGQIHDVTLCNVRVVGGPAPVSIIQGYDQDHIPTSITFEDVAIHGQPLCSAADAHLVTEKVRDVRFVVAGVTYPL